MNKKYVLKHTNICLKLRRVYYKNHANKKQRYAFCKLNAFFSTTTFISQYRTTFVGVVEEVVAVVDDAAAAGEVVVEVVVDGMVMMEQMLFKIKQN